MRKILKVLLALVAVALAAAGLWLYGWLCARDRDARVRSFAGAVVAENSPIAELATRRIVWKVVQNISTAAKDTVRETVFTIKVGYDLSDARLLVDHVAKTVELELSPPKIMSIDHFLQRTSVERKTLVERIFGANGEDGQADREDVALLAADCGKFNLLSTEKLRESVETLIASRLRDLGGYRLVLKDGRDIPAKVMFNAYFKEKGLSFRLAD